MTIAPTADSMTAGDLTEVPTEATVMKAAKKRAPRKRAAASKNEAYRASNGARKKINPRDEYKPWPQAKKNKALRDSKTAANTAKDGSLAENDSDSTDTELPTSKPQIGIKRKLGAALGGAASLKSGMRGYSRNNSAFLKA